MEKIENKKPEHSVLLWMIGVHILGIAALWHFSWANFAVFYIFYVISGCWGITMCYHRLLTHRSFSAPKWFERFLATCGALAMQGGPLEWVGHHRMHHAYSDKKDDPHNSNLGFWHCHVNWMLIYIDQFDNPKNQAKFARDITVDPYYRFLDSYWTQLAIQTLFGVILYSIGGIGMVLWGVFFRLMVLYHSTWFVNSATHMWGYKNYDSGDNSRNNWWVALLAFGEGWHNNHHAHQDIVEAGHKWWEFDITLNFIKLFHMMGLVYDLKTLKDKKVVPLTVTTIPKEVF